MKEKNYSYNGEEGMKDEYNHSGNEEPENEQENSNETVHENAETEDVESIKLILQDKEKQCKDYFDRLQRAAAEFDNFKKRTLKEKETIYSNAVADAVAAFLPVVDSIERAICTCVQENESSSVKEGIELVRRQFNDSMKNLGVEEIKCVGECFDPEIHNAVMHVEDESCGMNTVVEEFQKGYKINDKIIRHSMVKVAN